jgi:diacylglycerol kinase family enzyme
MKAAIIINLSGGSVQRLKINREMVETAFKQINFESKVYLVESTLIPETVKHALNEDFEIIVAGGGDGTIRAVAEILCETNIPLGILPLGTLNHFAKDLGIPVDFNDAVKVIQSGKIIDIDIAEVNGHKFINNSSIGIYPKIIKDRERQQKSSGMNKWLAMLIAIFRSLFYFPAYKVRLNADHEKFHCKTFFVFIGNNEYNMKLFTPVFRKNLDQGKLSLYFANCTGKYSLFKLIFFFIFDRLEQFKDFNSILVNEVWIDTKKHHPEVSVDGEVIRIESPLFYRILPKQLKVIVPETLPLSE